MIVLTINSVDSPCFVSAVPAGPPLVLDSSGRELRGSVGPLEEGQRTHLTCRSVGGTPEPTLSWWRDGHRIRQVGKKIRQTTVCYESSEQDTCQRIQLIRIRQTTVCYESSEQDTYLDTWSGFDAAKTASWPSRGLHHCGKFIKPSDE